MHRPCTFVRRVAVLVGAAALILSVGAGRGAARSPLVELKRHAAQAAACLTRRGGAVATPARSRELYDLAQRSTLRIRVGRASADVGIASSPSTAALLLELLQGTKTPGAAARRGDAVVLGGSSRIRRLIAACVPPTPLPPVRGGRAPASLADGTTIFTVAGTGVGGDSGDGGAATAAQIDQPRSIAPLPDGSYLVVEPFKNDVRRVWPDGTITRFAGTGVQGFSGDGGPATSAELNTPHSVSLLPSGSILLDDASNHKIREVSPDGTIRTVAGTGVGGYSGDGGPASQAELNAPRCVTAMPDGGFLIADTGNQRVRRVWPDGTITSVAGTGTQGFSGDGGAATAADLSLPFGVSPTPDGGFLVIDVGNQRIRRVSADGTITTVAGTGVPGYNGDGEPATAAELNNPHNVWATRDGGFLIADASNLRIRKVGADGTIATVAGTGVAGYTGDGGPAVSAEIAFPKAVAELPQGGLLVADTSNNVIRYVGAGIGPTSLSHPSVYGLAVPGQTLHASSGGWHSVPAADFSYQWLRCNPAGTGCATIPAATASTYQLSAADLDSTIRVAVTAANSAGADTAVSPETAIVAQPSTQPVEMRAPSIAGSPLDGETLTADPGTWAGTPPVAFRYQWQRCDSTGSGCTDIAGATASSYVVGSADFGSTLRVSVTATNGATANAYENTVLADQPVSYWRFDDTDGTLRDSEGFRDGIYLARPTAATSLLSGDADAAVSFDGATQYADVPAAPAWTTTPFTIEVLVRPSQLPVNKTIWSEIGPGLTGWWLNTGPNGQIRMFIGDGSGYRWTDPGVVLSPDTTYDIAASYDGANARLYVNGTLISTGPAARLATNVGNSPMRFAAFSTGPGQFWPGTIDDASFYGSILSADRIAAHAAAKDASAPVAVSPATPPAGAAPPHSTSAPTINAAATVGQSVHATDGNWNGTAPIQYADQWRRCDAAGNGCVDIVGATSADYTATTADQGHSLRFVVTATNAVGTSVASSAAAPVQDVVAPPAPAPPQGSGSGGGGGGGGVPPDLHVEWTASTAVSPPVGAELWVTATISTVNVGASSETRVSISLPPGLAVTRIYADRGPGCTATSPTALECDAAWISPGTETHITIWGAVGGSGEQDFTATATSIVEREATATATDNTATLKLPAATAPLTPPSTGTGRPLLQSAPVLLGPARAGKTLRVRGAVWTITPRRASYTWELCTRTRCARLAITQAPKLQLPNTLKRVRIRVIETAASGTTTLTAISAPLAVRATPTRRR